MAKKIMLDLIPIWNGQENNARSNTDLVRQKNEQRSENEISSLAGVDSSDKAQNARL